MKNRREIIDHALSDLRSLKRKGSFSNQYALNENIAFFESIRSISSYIKWLIVRAPKLDREKLLELTDLQLLITQQTIQGIRSHDLERIITATNDEDRVSLAMEWHDKRFNELLKLDEYIKGLFQRLSESQYYSYL